MGATDEWTDAGGRSKRTGARKPSRVDGVLANTVFSMPKYKANMPKYKANMPKYKATMSKYKTNMPKYNTNILNIR